MSIGSVDDAYDSAMAESFFASLDCQLVERRNWKSFVEARMATFTWIESWYNPRRRHSGIGQKSPINFEKAWSQQRATAPIRRYANGLPNGFFAPVDKPPLAALTGPSACPQASPLDNPALALIEPPSVRSASPKTQSRCVREIRISSASTSPCKQISAVLRSACIDIVKCDMNRDFTHAGGADGRMGVRAHVLGLYGLLAQQR